MLQSATGLAASYFPAFEWLRAVLAITVMLAHDSVITWRDGGTFAVQVFFVLSGWLIGGILLNTARADLPRFYFNRAVRIWTPYYIAFALLVAASLLKDNVGEKWFEFVLYKLLMVWNLFGSHQLADFRALMPLQGTGNHFWSVNAEEQFYLLSPVLLVLIPRLGRSMVVWALLIAVAVATRSIYCGILLGVLAAVAAAKYGPFHTHKLVQFGLVILAAACAAGLALDGPFAVLGPLFGISAVLLLAVPGRPSRWAKIAGGMSYPLYLNHWIGVYVGNALLAPYGLRDSVPRQVFASLFSIGVAVWLYWYVERRLLAQREAWYTERLGRAIQRAGYVMVLGGCVFGAYKLMSAIGSS